MTIEEAIKEINWSSKVHKKILETDAKELDIDSAWVKHWKSIVEAFDIAIATMRKYQQLQADYENRLKADMVAMLTEIQLEIKEQNHKGSNCYRDGYTPYSEGLDDCKDIIQQKINALKAESEDQDGQTSN